MVVPLLSGAKAVAKAIHPWYDHCAMVAWCSVLQQAKGAVTMTIHGQLCLMFGKLRVLLTLTFTR